MEPAHLLRKLVCHDSLCVLDIQMCEVDQHLPHTFVQHNGVTLLHELSNNLSFVVFDDQYLECQLLHLRCSQSTNLFWLDHLLNHHQPQVRQDIGVCRLP